MKLPNSFDQLEPCVNVQDGLAIYTLGHGRPLLLLPYPHGSTHGPMVEGPLAALLAGIGRQVITFDPPGAYRSNRLMRGDMAEMLDCAKEALAVRCVAGPLDVVGHSMGGLCALGLTIEQPKLVDRLVLVCTLSGWAATRRWSVPHNWRPWRDRAWWQCMWYGARQIMGLGNLAVYKRLNSLVAEASYVEKRYAETWPIEPGDEDRSPPLRAIWLRTVRNVDYRDRLSQVAAPTLICAGRYDPQTPLPCSQEVHEGIVDAQLVLFERSGHAPFVEEPDRFVGTVEGFFAAT